jgi:hypothetical protein
MRNMEAQTFVQVMKRLYEITFQNSVSGYWKQSCAQNNEQTQGHIIKITQSVD